METKAEERSAIIMLDRSSKILFLLFAFAVIFSIAVAFFRFVVFRDYVIEAQVDCDPSFEACFVWECDPESEEDGEMCTGNPEEDVWHYKIIRKNAMNIPACDSHDEECQPMTCMDGELECEYSFCEEGSEDDVPCSSSVDFAEDTETDNAEIRDNEDVESEGSIADDEIPVGGNPVENSALVVQ